MSGTSYYLHTLNGHPALFTGEEILEVTDPRCHVEPGGIVLTASEEQIREEQRISIAHRRARGLPDDARYAAVRVRVPRSS